MVRINIDKAVLDENALYLNRWRYFHFQYDLARK